MSVMLNELVQRAGASAGCQTCLDSSPRRAGRARSHGISTMTVVVVWFSVTRSLCRYSVIVCLAEEDEARVERTCALSGIVRVRAVG